MQRLLDNYGIDPKDVGRVEVRRQSYPIQLPVARYLSHDHCAAGGHGVAGGQVKINQNDAYEAL